MYIRTIEWKAGKIKIIDQTRLPAKLEYVYISTLKELWRSIKLLQVRGAPALGAAAALGVYLGVKDSKAFSFEELYQDVEKTIAYLATSRPTARNLFWALERMRGVALNNRDKRVSGIKDALLEEAFAVMEEDRVVCRAIGRNGSRLIHNNDTIMTLCNAGALATIDYGTALGVIYRAIEEGKKIKVYVCETRPLLQGARLTTWELRRKGIEATLLCDNMAAVLMSEGRIKRVIAGADRIASNGDTANKIGTYNLAVLSHYHRIPFYIAAPQSTFDLSIHSGNEIPIEQRSAEEITSLFFRRPITVRGVKIYNPAFDVTPQSLISGIITERGIIEPPYFRNIREIFGKP